MIQVNALVVDDSGIMRKMVMKNLSMSGLAEFTFAQAADGVEALKIFDPETTDVMFVDINMPNMGGLELVRKVREIETRHVLIVMITSEKTMGKVEEALDDAGADGYIAKPFTSIVLHKKLKPLFDELAQARKPKGGFFSRLASKLAE